MLTLAELAAETNMVLERNGYSISHLKVCRSGQKRFIEYAQQQREEYYSESLAAAYFSDCYGSPEKISR